MSSYTSKLLWGDMPEEQAQINLRKVLSHLRAALPGVLLAEHSTVSLDPARVLSVDVQDFAAGCSGQAEPRSPSGLSAAVGLYRGELLEGFYVAGAPDYERWLADERERLRGLYVEALERLAARQAAQSDVAGAISYLRRVLAVEPWREETQRALMRLLASSGQRGAALAQYEACRRALREELDVEPGAETLALYAAIREGKLGAGFGGAEVLSGAARPPNAGRGSPDADAYRHEADGSRAISSRLPTRPTPFVGRRRELENIVSLLADPSCRLLTEAEQAVFGRLSVFEGGFSREAAGQAAGASLAVLARFVHKSLLRAGGEGRYHMHERLRQYAAARLAEAQEQQAAALAAHRDYYLGYLAAREPLLVGSARQRALREIGAEIANIRVAWARAAGQGCAEAIGPAVDPLFTFYASQNRFREGREVFACAVEQLTSAGDARGQAEWQAVIDRLRARWGAFLSLLGELDAAAEVLGAALAAARARDDAREVALALSLLGDIRQTWHGPDGQLALRHEALAIYRALGDLNGITERLLRLTIDLAASGRPEESRQAAAEALAFSRQAGRSDLVAEALHKLAFTAHLRGEYDEAERLYREGQVLYEELGNELGVASNLCGLAWTLGAVSAGDPQPGAWQRMLQYAQVSTAAIRRAGHRIALGETLTFLADAAIMLGQYEVARQWVLEAVNIRRAISKEYPVGTNWHLSVLAEACHLAGDCAAARRYLLAALQGFAASAPLIQGEVLYRLAAFLARPAPSGTETLQAEQRERQLALCILLAEHPASEHRTRLRAAHLAARLSAELPPAAVAAAAVLGRALSLTQAGLEAQALLAGEV